MRRPFDPAGVVIEGELARLRGRKLIEDIYSPCMRGFEARLPSRSRDFLQGLVRSLQQDFYVPTEKQLAWLEKLYTDLGVDSAKELAEANRKREAERQAESERRRSASAAIITNARRATLLEILP